MSRMGQPRRLSALDNAFLAVEGPASPMHVSCLAVYEMDAGLGDRPTHLVTEVLGHAVPDVPVLRRTLLPSMPRVNRAYWSGTGDVDVRDHIRTLRLLGNGDTQDLLDTAATVHARRLPRGRPLWEATVIRGLASPEGGSRERFAVLFTIHHAAVDGVSGMALFARLHGRSAHAVESMVGGPAVPGPSWTRRVHTTWSDNLDAMAGPQRAAVRLGRRLRHRPDAPVGRPPLALPWTPLNQAVQRERVVGVFPVSRADVREVRAAVPGATVNDVLLATVGGALRMLLARDGAPIDRDLVAGVPVARLRREFVETGNDFDLVRIPLGVDEPAPLRRLIAVQRASEHGKHAHASGAVELDDAAAVLPGWLLSAALRVSPVAARLGVPLPAVSTIVSNVPGPRFPLYLGPAELVDLHALGPIANGLSVFHMITSYRDHVNLTVTSSPAVIGDASAYVELLGRSFAQLASAAQHSRSVAT